MTTFKVKKKETAPDGIRFVERIESYWAAPKI
jgi:hypothetical protein